MLTNVLGSNVCGPCSWGARRARTVPRRGCSCSARAGAAHDWPAYLIPASRGARIFFFCAWQLGRALRLDGDAARLLTQRALLALLAASLPDLAPEHRARMRALWQQPPPPAARRADIKVPGGGGGLEESPEPAGAAEAALAAPVLPVVRGLADKTVAAATGEPANGHLQGAHGGGCSCAEPQGEALRGSANGGVWTGCVRASDRAVYAALASGYVWKLDVTPCAAA